MSKNPNHNWLRIQERERNPLVFMAEWACVFLIAWMFWSLMFHWAPGSMPPAQAAVLLSALYATVAIYGRVLRATGCRKCGNPMPFMRREIGRRKMPDKEECVALEYGGEAWEFMPTQMYTRMIRTEIVTFRCRKCDQVWEEKLEKPATTYKPVRSARTRR